MDRVADLRASEIDFNRVWNSVSRGMKFNIVTNYVEYATALDTMRSLLVVEVDRYMHVHVGIGR